MTKALLALVMLFSAPAFSAEPQGDVLFFAGDRNSDDARAALWTANGYQVQVIEVGPGEALPALDIDPNARHVFVAGSGVGAALAVQFARKLEGRVEGLLLLGPELVESETLPAVPILVERLDERENLKRWVNGQMQMGRAIQDVRFFDESQLHQRLARRLTVEFLNAALAGTLKRVVP